jgi:two-component system OmpR family response regulator
MRPANTPHLLLAEDDALLADALTGQLQRAGFEVEHAPNGAVADYLLLKQTYDVAIIDVGLPMMDGLAVIRHLREAQCQLPVIILTALDSLDDRVAGLNAGADDYLTKPFDFPELEARLHALMRRSRPQASAASFGQLVFDHDARRATANGEPLDLSPREWMLLELLLSQRDRVVTKDRILEAWDLDRSEGGGSGAIEVYIHRLRRKLEHSGLAIRTVRGLGYLLEADAPAT